LCRLKLTITALPSIPIASYCSIERLVLINFSLAQQDHLLNEIGITMKITSTLLLTLISILCFPLTALACTDPVVLVHGNTATPSSWEHTYDLLISEGYSANNIYRPDWGSKTCAACNNHSGSEETPVRQALTDALNNSCSGQIDVIAHSMGATLAAQQIDKLAIASNVDSFVSIAGAFRGLRSCGIYPFNIWSSTCGVNGLSIQSPFLDSIYGQPFANRTYSIKSYIDQIVCSTGFCTVGGIHSSQIWNEDASYTYALGHFGLQTDTAQMQYDLIK